MKRRSERRKHCALAVVMQRQNFPRLPGGAGRPKFNQLEMVTTFTYRSSLVNIDARNFEISCMVTDPQTHTQTQPQTHRQDRLQYTAPLSLARSVVTLNVTLNFKPRNPNLACLGKPRYNKPRDAFAQYAVFNAAKEVIFSWALVC